MPLIKGQPFVIDAEQVQCGGMEIVRVGGIHRCLPAQFIRGTVASAALNTSAGHPCGESAGIVVAAFAVVALSDGLAAEFGGADYQRFIKQPTRLEILEQSCRAAVEHAPQ